MKQSKLKTMLYFLEGCKRYFVLAIACVFIHVIFDLINPKIMGYTVDFIVQNDSQIPGFVMRIIENIGGRAYIMDRLWIVALIVLMIGLLSALSRYLFGFFNQMAGEKLTKRMRDMLFDHILKLPFGWHDNNQTGDIIQRCTSDVDLIRNFVSDQMVNLFRMIALIILALYFMLNISVYLTLAAMFFLVIEVGYSMVFHGKVGPKFEKVDTEEGQFSALCQENLAGVRVIRAFGRELFERKRFEEKNGIYIGHWVDMMRLLATFWTISDFVKGLQLVTVISYGSYLTINGHMSAGQFVAFISYNIMIVQPIIELGRVISEMSKAGISLDRLRYIMDSELEKDEKFAEEFPGEGDIVFDNVSFSYDKKEVLKNININIKKGQTVGILGGTGSGKSTLMMLLDNLYDLSNGTIYINGVDIKKIKRSSLRKNIGFVLQEPYLFSRSLEDNIKIAKGDAEFGDVEKVVEAASLTSSINKFKEGYKTFVGERGVTLSGGQKQRTAIAQMLILNPPIMIFDDSLSAVDAKTDANIRASLNELNKKATVIIISHRITTIMNADNIYVLNEGAIVQEGNHSELISKEGIYKNIFDMQRAIDEED